MTRLTKQDFPGRPVDRGHLIPNAAGGEFGPNIYRQDRALNRGHSREGRLYRAIETAAVQGGHFFFCALEYCDDSDFPALVELGIVIDKSLQTVMFRNRFDPRALSQFPSSDDLGTRLQDLLGTMANVQIGDVGEETARAWLEAELDAVIVTVGDSGAERDGHNQDLDLTVVVDGRFVAIEVKTRYFGSQAGRLTQKGNLFRPRLNRARTRHDSAIDARQGTPAYAAARLKTTLDNPDDGIAETVVVAVDLRAMLVQWFPVSDNGKILAPTHPPWSCLEYALQGVESILEYSGVA